MILMCTLGSTVLLFFLFSPTSASYLITGEQTLPEDSLYATQWVWAQLLSLTTLREAGEPSGLGTAALEVEFGLSLLQSV